ncbi:MAG: lipid-A-disaccharide synthase [Dysgonamonadaceae bacterium]|jgi:lipid-A-disaccharide synthase|nr:lipid-A-disaccharide synthase [Dysgonamonadaceae bacterium]MDD4398516.1 lipid-A-disaccharide synthase [Dysgonamonadaceae bacterium]MEA5081235.1 lipid-A-disaccharide synthase [Dysgonamonadaceae bacterium]
MRFYLIAGEASGDLHASILMKSLKKLYPNSEYRFFGGDLMQAQGGTLVKHYREMAYMGIIPVITHARAILNNLKLCKKDIAQYKPDAIILVDYPGFNLKIAKYVKTNLQIPVYYYISPKVWAWKTYRVKLFKKYVDHMLCILPFEVDFFKKHNYSVHYVGNPSVNEIDERDYKNESFNEFIADNDLPNKPIIALLAGSRKNEIADNLPAMLQSVKDFDEYQIVIAGVPSIERSVYNTYIQGFPVSVFFGQTYRILAQSKAALVTSGTATLETALLNVPQVVCYKTPLPKLSYWGFKHIFHIPYISLVNLISGKEVVRELFAKYFNIENIREELYRILKVNDYRQIMLDNYSEMRKILGNTDASDNAAQVIWKTLQNKP